MQLIYLNDILEGNYHVLRDRFETDSVNVIAACCKETKEISIYISFAHSIRKPWKLSLGKTTINSFVSHTGLYQTLEKLDDLEKVIYNDVIKSS